MKKDYLSQELCGRMFSTVAKTEKYSHHTFRKKLVPFDVAKWPIVKAMARESSLGIRDWFDTLLAKAIERRNRKKGNQ